MNKIILQKGDYEFDASAKTITILTKLELFNAESVIGITNITDNIIIYQFACKGFGGTFGYDTLVLEYDTSEMSDTDVLQIVCYIPETETNNSRLLEAIKLQAELSEEILQQLKIINLYNHIAYDIEFDETNLD
jgi:hypothetical protein